MSKHTPGEWHASESTAYGTAPWARRWVVNAKDPDAPGSGRLVQIVSLMGDAKRAAEDARLIAAAPELYAALEGVMDAFGPLLGAVGGVTVQEGQALEKMNAALAKARGGK